MYKVPIPGLCTGPTQCVAALHSGTSVMFKNPNLKEYIQMRKHFYHRLITIRIEN